MLEKNKAEIALIRNETKKYYDFFKDGEILRCPIDEFIADEFLYSIKDFYCTSNFYFYSFFLYKKKKSRLIFSIRLIFKVTIVESTLMKLLLFLILPSLRLVSNF